MDSLRKRVLAYDRQRNTERQIEVTERPTACKLICLECRKSPNSLALLNAWEKAHPAPWLGKRPRWPGLQGKCPECSGRLVEVVW